MRKDLIDLHSLFDFDLSVGNQLTGTYIDIIASPALDVFYQQVGVV